MVKIVHNTLPIKEKIIKRINKEIENNRAKNTENTFQQNRYKHITDNKCTFCKAEPKTANHLITCKHEFVEKIYFEAHKRISIILNTNKVQYHTPGINPNNILPNVTTLSGSKGIIHKKVLELLDAGENPKSIKFKMLKVQKTIIKAALTVWAKRNKILFKT